MNTVDRARSLLYGAPVDKKSVECQRCGDPAPRCAFYNGWCGNKADISAWVPITWRPPLKFAPKFACNDCWRRLNQAWDTTISFTLPSPERATTENKGN